MWRTSARAALNSSLALCSSSSCSSSQSLISLLSLAISLTKLLTSSSSPSVVASSEVATSRWASGSILLSLGPRLLLFDVDLLVSCVTFRCSGGAFRSQQSRWRVFARLAVGRFRGSHRGPSHHYTQSILEVGIVPLIHNYTGGSHSVCCTVGFEISFLHLYRQWVLGLAFGTKSACII